MLDKLKKFNVWNVILKSAMIFCTFGIAITILLFTRFSYNSDFSYATNLALEQMKQLKLYPDNWNFSTGYYVFSINLFSMPFLLFLKNHILCREFAIITLCGLMFFLLHKVFAKVSKKIFYITVILLFIPLTGVVHWYFYDGNYFNFAIMQMLVFLFVKAILFDEEKKSKTILYILYGILIIIVVNDGLRNQLTITIPLVLSVAMYNYKKHEKKIFEKKYLIFMAVTIFTALTGYILYRIIQTKVGWRDTDTDRYFFVGVLALFDNLRKYIEGVYGLYGITDAELVSLRGITNCINWMYATFATFIIPAVVIRNYGKIKEEFIKLTIIFCTVCNIFIIFMAFSTTASGERFLLPVYFNNIIFMGIFIANIGKTFWAKYYEIILLIIIMIVLVNYVNYFKTAYMDGKIDFSRGAAATFFEPEDDTGLSQFLEENGLEFGYAVYADAYRNSSFANNNIRMVSFENGEPLVKDFWMNSTLWYDECRGKCFLLLKDVSKVNEIYYQTADETLYYTATYKNVEYSFLEGTIDYVILVFDKNIREYPEIIKLIENIE